MTAALTGCGGTSNPFGLDPDAGSSSSTTDDGGASPLADGGASPVADGGTTTLKDQRLDPIEVGRAWTYNVKVIGVYPSCENGLGVATTVSKSTKGGRTAFQVQSLCKNAGTFEYAVDNDRVWYFFGDAWHLASDEPVTDGHKWNDGIYDYHWEDSGTVTVAAGTFEKCWTARLDVGYEWYTTFCRGVGPVHWHYEDGLGNGYDAILTNRNF
jgi:hypothetical protein